MKNDRYLLYALLGIITVFLTSGCTQVSYFSQAAHGQLCLLSNARPIDDWLANPNLNGRLRAKLIKVKHIRQFAARELGLPDNRSYTNYAELQRPFVLWNVVATGELSLDQLSWCFPIAGCVSYRGYYSKTDAQNYANTLRLQGMDVQVAGVPAYSTLGWFNDPVLSTFIHYPDAELARLIFHELAHQVVYVKDDTQFNESFATAVEEVGVEQWLKRQSDPQVEKTYLEYEQRKKDFLALLLKHRAALEKNYKLPVSDEIKRQRKAEIFKALKDDYRLLKIGWGGYTGYDRWFAEPLSNAHLASVATYHDFVPAFRALFDEQKSFSKFYSTVRELAKLNKKMRHQQLTLKTENLVEPKHIISSPVRLVH
jgi:predicted aminopeptidase